MKNKIKVILLILIIFLVSGCNKFDSQIDIYEDKSMDLSFAIADGKEININEEFFKSKKFRIDEYKEDNLVGYKFIKRYNDIDEITTNRKFSIKIKSFEENKDLDYKYLFYRNIKGNYEGNYIYDLTSVKEDVSYTFTLKLPFNTISNNATKIEDNGRTLIWEFEKGKENNVFFEFNYVNSSFDPMGIYIANKKIIIYGGGTFLGVIFFISLIINTIKVAKEKKPKKENEKQTVSGLESKVIGQMINTNNNQNNKNNNLQS